MSVCVHKGNASHFQEMIPTWHQKTRSGPGQITFIAILNL